VSNLAFIGKIIEKTSVNRFSGHICDNNLDELLQSAYKEKHSVETALLVVFDDLLRAIDDNKHILITLLDYSAAFDTIDHGILFTRLCSSYGLSGDALEWVKSYFSNRHQTVTIKGITSEQQDLTYGMPQGSVVGPFGYPKYSAPIARIAEKHHVKYHQYADDTQLYMICNKDDVNVKKEILEECIEEVRSWSTNNMLKLNDSKTEFLVVGSKFARNKPDVQSIVIGDQSVEVTSSARNIGVIMDSNLTMADHVSNICKSSYSHLRNISQIRKYLTQDATKTLIHSLVTSRLDNMNSLLFGLPDNIISRLQKIQNHAAKLVMKKKKYDHVTPILQSLHWLPIHYRIHYKLLLTTHKCLNGLAPEYLSSRLQKYIPGRSLRSADQHLLVEQKVKLKSYGERAFSIAAPKLWNELPLDLRKCENLHSFKSKIKTLLFKRAYNV